MEFCPGQVTRAIYYGTKIEYDVTLPDNTVIIVEVYNPQLTQSDLQKVMQ